LTTANPDTDPTNDSQTVSTNISDVSVTPSGGFRFTAVEGLASSSQTVATFTDAGGAEVVRDYSATIDWGDSSTSSGSIAVAGDGFTVSGW
jgi:hypothetical protein